MSNDCEADDPAMLMNSSILYLPAISHAVINGSFDRDPSLSIFSTFYVNSNDTGPFPSPNASQPFVAESKDFYNIIGSEAKLEVVTEDSAQQFHEAGVYVPATNEVLLTSNQLKASNTSASRFPIYGNLNKISLTPNGNGTLPWETVTPSSDSFILPNGGTFYNDKVLMATQGYELDVASALIAIDPKTLQSEVLLNNFYGRPFNSMNDVAVLLHEGGGDTGVEDQWVFFTDPPYGYYQKFKPYPRLPSQVYAFHPPSGTIRVVADGFDRPNGVAFSPDMKTCYITDTGFANGVADDPLALDGSRPGTIYAYDVTHPPAGSDPRTRPPALSNRRVFAFTDSGMLDGIKCDTEGNVYAGCFDGVHVWNQYGALLGKILLGLDLPVTSNTGLVRRGCVNLVFVPGGLLMLAEERAYMATIKAKGALLP